MTTQQERTDRFAKNNADELMSRFTAGGQSQAAGNGLSNAEVTGVRSLIAHLNEVADAHAGHGSGEGFLGSLEQMDVGQGDQQMVRDAQEASANAARAWQDAAESVTANNLAVSEQYSLNPDAANKQANTNE